MPRRAIDELVWLLNRYGDLTKRVNATDNIIPFNYFDTFLPMLEGLGLELEIFYETKANLKESQIIRYKKAGLTSIQPGIESFVTEVLSLMRKGVTALQNIQTMKLCRQHGIKVHWNYMWGFPGENPTLYDHQPGLLKLLYHLEPPDTAGAARFDRFSPFGEEPDAFGIKNLQPFAAYAFTYPHLDVSERRRHAYFFTGDFSGDEYIPAYAFSMREAISAWKENFAAAALYLIPYEDGTSAIVDTREATGKVLILNREGTAIVEHLNSIIGFAALLASTADETATAAGNDGREKRLQALLADLVRCGLILREESRYLGIALTITAESRPTASVFASVRQLLTRTAYWHSATSETGSVVMYSPASVTDSQSTPFGGHRNVSNRCAQLWQLFLNCCEASNPAFGTAVN